MKNYKNTGWIKEMQDQPDEKSGNGLNYIGFVFLLFGNQNLTSFKGNKISDNPRQEM